MKTKFDITLFSLYKEYKKYTPNPVTEKQFKTFYKQLGEELFEYIVEGNVISLPSSWGQLFLTKKKPKVIEDEGGNLRLLGYAPDWQLCWKKWGEKYPGRTREEIKAIPDKQIYYHRNNETDGHRLTLFFNKKQAKIKAKSLLNFYFVRSKNRKLTELIKNGSTKKYEYNEY
jgi:hypothetical protein